MPAGHLVTDSQLDDQGAAVTGSTMRCITNECARYDKQAPQPGAIGQPRGRGEFQEVKLNARQRGSIVRKLVGDGLGIAIRIRRGRRRSSREWAAVRP